MADDDYTPPSIFEVDTPTRRARLAALIRVASKEFSGDPDPHELLARILRIDPGEGRVKLLKDFFSTYIPGGWQEGAEDQEFLIYTPIQGKSFWIDW